MFLQQPFWLPFTSLTPAELWLSYLHSCTLQGAVIQPEVPGMIVTPGPYYLLQIYSLLHLPRY